MFGEVLQHIGAFVDEVAPEKSAGDRVMGLDETVAALHPIAAEHDQVLAQIVPRVLIHVMERELVGLAAKCALPPLQMKSPKKGGILHPPPRPQIRLACHSPSPEVRAPLRCIARLTDEEHVVAERDEQLPA